jgi:hypothetical protein
MSEPAVPATGGRRADQDGDLWPPGDQLDSLRAAAAKRLELA